jgi:hypothetical protein
MQCRVGSFASEAKLDIYEITGFKTGVEHSGVNFLDPPDAFQDITNGYVYRQELKSREGFTQFGNRLADKTRVMGIFEDILPNSTNELLVFSTKFLYKYTSATDSFTQIAFNARILALVPAFTLGITDNAAYISGTTYLTKTGTRRFVFTSKDIATAPLTPGNHASGVYFYDGTSIGDFFNTTDNPDAQEPSATLGGDITHATKVIAFGERLNFFNPVLGATTYQQGVLYSGIRDAAGNGDKFNTPGSGLLSADTYEIMNGASVNGNIIVMNFEKSNYTLEKTRDAFNPYLIRRIPSTLIGTDAAFSSVSWGGETKSLGRNGMVTTDGRMSLRFDNKIPYFTRDEIDQENINLCYGGFSKSNSQFLFIYRDIFPNFTELTQNRVATYNYEENTWSFYDLRFSCFGQTDQGKSLSWDEIDAVVSPNHPSWARWDTTEEIWDKVGVEAYVAKDLAGDNDGFVYRINNDYDDYFVAITNITAAANAVVTVAQSAFKLGDYIVIENAEGMIEINDYINPETGKPIQIIAATDTSITLDINSTNFTAYTGNGSISKVIDFSAEFSPFNPYRAEGRKVYVSYVEILFNTKGSGTTLLAYADEDQSPFKTVDMEPDNDLTIDRQWIGASINQEANFITFELSEQTWNNQTTIYSVRVHCKRGSLTGN